jgi:hypothetical protein
MRFIASHSPLNGPCSFSACTAYSEQEGSKRQEGGFSGDMQYR